MVILFANDTIYLQHETKIKHVAHIHGEVIQVFHNVIELSYTASNAPSMWHCVSCQIVTHSTTTLFIFIGLVEALFALKSDHITMKLHALGHLGECTHAFSACVVFLSHYVNHGIFLAEILN